MASASAWTCSGAGTSCERPTGRVALPVGWTAFSAETSPGMTSTATPFLAMAVAMAVFSMRGICSGLLTSSQ